MPLLQFYTSPGQLTAAEKQEVASTLTAKYAKIMPAFFVNVIFHELPHGSFFMGGAPADGRFIRFTADHIYVNWNKNHEQEMDFMKWLGDMFRERFEHRGWMWEFHVTESNRDLWRIQSLVPPPRGSEAMQSWREAGKGISWDGMEKFEE